MIIRMLKDHAGSYDGIHVHRYGKGTEYEVDKDHLMPFDLAEVFLEHGYAEEVHAAKKAPPGPSETKEPPTKGKG